MVNSRFVGVAFFMAAVILCCGACDSGKKQAREEAKTFAQKGLEAVHAGRFQEGVELLTKATQLDPDSPLYFVNLTSGHMGLKQYNEAAKACEKAIELKPDFLEAYYNCGMAYGSADRYQEAALMFRKVTELKPGFQEGHVFLGLSYAKMGKNPDAVSSLKKAIALNAKSPLAHYHLGSVYAAMGMKKEADEELAVLGTIQPELANKLADEIGKAEKSGVRGTDKKAAIRAPK